MKMNKIAKMLLVFTSASLLLTGCSMSSSWKLSIKNEGVYTPVSRSGEMGSWAWQDMDPANPDVGSTGYFSAKKDGEYTVVVKDDDGNQYTITMIINGGKAEVKTDEGISVLLEKN